MAKKDRFSLFALGAALLFALLGGCSTAQQSARAVAPAPVAITKGMPVEDLVEAMGEPSSVQADPTHEGLEIWKFVRSSVDTRLVSSGIEEIPYWNPITGVYQPEQRDIMTPQTTTRKVMYEFLIAEGAVLAWKVEEDEDVYHNR